MRYSPPVCMLNPMETPYGTQYLPANTVATNLCALTDRMAFSADKLPYLKKLGYEVIFMNGQSVPIPHPNTQIQA